MCSLLVRISFCGCKSLNLNSTYFIYLTFYEESRIIYFNICDYNIWNRQIAKVVKHLPNSSLELTYYLWSISTSWFHINLVNSCLNRDVTCHSISFSFLAWSNVFHKVDGWPCKKKMTLWGINHIIFVFSYGGVIRSLFVALLSRKIYSGTEKKHCKNCFILLYSFCLF